MKRIDESVAALIQDIKSGKKVGIMAEDKVVEKLVYVVEKIKKAIPGIRCEYTLEGIYKDRKDSCRAKCLFTFD